jgi:hypothetical protein
MAQRIFAPANGAAEATRTAQTRGPVTDRGRGDTHCEQGTTSSADERARAAAYLDLWERQLMHAAVHGELRVGHWRDGA